jgi:hypothetical protein
LQAKVDSNAPRPSNKFKSTDGYWGVFADKHHVPYLYVWQDIPPETKRLFETNYAYCHRYGGYQLLEDDGQVRITVLNDNGGMFIMFASLLRDQGFLPVL